MNKLIHKSDLLIKFGYSDCKLIIYQNDQYEVKRDHQEMLAVIFEKLTNMMMSDGND